MAPLPEIQIFKYALLVKDHREVDVHLIVSRRNQDNKKPRRDSHIDQ